MFLGHHAAGFAAKRLAPQVSLGTLFFAAMLLDLIWPLLLLAGVEHVRIAPDITAVTPLDFYDYPWTHSLLMVAALSIVVALLWRNAVAGALVLSHWVLDFIAHRPDLPLWPDGPKVGLGLWNNLAATVLVETGLFAAGLMLYLRATAARDRTGNVALWSLVAFTIVVYMVSLFGPPRPSAMAIGWGGLAAWLFVPWGSWIDRHRRPRA